jgi:hypothetical protein
MLLDFGDRSTRPAPVIAVTVVAILCTVVWCDIPLLLLWRSWEETQRLLVLLGGALLTALAAHWLVPSWMIASWISAFVFALAENLVLLLSVPKSHAFSGVELVAGATLGFGVATLTGLPFYFKRRGMLRLREA